MMKKTICAILILFMMSMALAGCGSNDPVPTSVGGDKLTDDKPAATITKPAADAAPTVESVAKTDMSPELKALLTKYTKRSSYSYLDSTNKNHYSVKGDKIKIELYDQQGPIGDYYDVVYMEKTSKKAYGFCADLPNCNKDAPEYRIVSFDQFNPKLPLTYLSEIKDGVIKGSETCENFKCIQVDYTKAGKNYRMLIMDYSGLPYSITEIGKEGVMNKIMSFTDQAYDHLKDADVNLPSGAVLR